MSNRRKPQKPPRRNRGQQAGQQTATPEQASRIFGAPTMRVDTDAFGRTLMPDAADPAGWQAMAEETHTNARALLSTDPALGIGTPATIGPSMQTVSPMVTDPTAEAVPVVLFEPAKAMMVGDPTGGGVREMQVEMICRVGLQRWTPGAFILKTAQDWYVQRVGKTLELRDNHGGLWADADLVPDPEWISAATSQHYVTVLYGPKLGVRVPPELPAARYGDAERKAELTEARGSGMVAAAIVEWRG